MYMGISLIHHSFSYVCTATAVGSQVVVEHSLHRVPAVATAYNVSKHHEINTDILYVRPIYQLDFITHEKPNPAIQAL